VFVAAQLMKTHKHPATFSSCKNMDFPLETHGEYKKYMGDHNLEQLFRVSTGSMNRY
jgi:hypothetical protein